MEEAAEFMHVPVATLRTWVHHGRAPRSARIGKRRMFLKADCEKFVMEKFEHASPAVEAR